MPQIDIEDDILLCFIGYGLCCIEEKLLVLVSQSDKLKDKKIKERGEKKERKILKRQAKEIKGKMKNKGVR